MELGSDSTKELQDESVWVPKTPAKFIPAKLKSEDIFSVGTFSSPAPANQHHGLNQSDEEALNEDSKAQSDETESFIKSASRSILTLSKRVYTRKKRKSNTDRKYRPKVVSERKVKNTPKIKTSNLSTLKPHTPKPPNRGTSRSRLGNKSDSVSDDTLKAFPEASQDICLDFSQVSVPNPGISPVISLGVGSTGLDESCDRMLVDLKPDSDSISCRRALNFNLLLENDRREQTKDSNASCSTFQRVGNSYPILVYRRRFKMERCNLLTSRNFGPDFPKISKNQRDAKDSNASCAKWQRDSNSYPMLVYQRRFKLERCDLLNRRKFGPDFPKMFRKERTKRTKTSRTLLWAVGAQNGTIKNHLISAIAAKDAKLNIVRKRRTGRRENVFPALPSVVGTNGNPKLINLDLFPPLSTPKVRRMDVSVRKLYCGFLIPLLGPPPKKLKGLEGIMKKFQHLHIDDVGKQGGQKKKRTSGVGKKHGELVLHGPKKQVPKVDIDQETEREWTLLMRIFRGGAEEERGEDREKWWEEQRKLLHVRMLIFVSIMHIMQGDRRFSEWKGSVVDSVVGVFLTQNVSDHLSSSAFISLASRFPVKHRNELQYVKSCPTESIPIVQEVEPERGECSRNTRPLKRECVLQDGIPSMTTGINFDKNQAKTTDWDDLRKSYASGADRETSSRYSDSVDWEAVRRAPPEQVADAIKMRGQNVILGEKIQDFLNRIVKDHGSIDLEWLRNVPPDKAKDYLLSFKGLGLKSVECVRLLCLHHKAFPVDTNVARVAVRLGWVPIQPLPGGLEFHLLDQYPLMDKVQVYLWPRLCTLDQKTLYELHYQMITFGKVFCKKKKPSCGTCPLKGECKHYASAVASTRLSLPGTTAKSASSAIVSISAVEDSMMVNASATESSPGSSYQTKNVEPIIEYPKSPLPVSDECLIRDIEDWYGQSEDEDVDINVGMNVDEDVKVNVNVNVDVNVDVDVDVDVDENEDVNEDEDEVGDEDDDEDEDLDMNVDGEDIPTIRVGTLEGDLNEDDTPIVKLDTEELKKSFREAMHECNIVLPDDDVSKALMAFTSEAASIPAPKLKNVGRLKTVHHVYELPDSHPILAGVERRVPDDPSPYLLVIWASDGDAGQPKTFRSQSCSQSLELCDADMCCSSDYMEGQNLETVPGTLMIPCRTANRGRFPLNGTYFQVNEVFADDVSAEHPIQVPRKWLWNLKRRLLYCGHSASAIFTGSPVEEIQHCFWRGFICVRAFNRRTRAPVILPDKFHEGTTTKGKGKGKRNLSQTG